MNLMRFLEKSLNCLLARFEDTGKIQNQNIEKTRHVRADHTVAQTILFVQWAPKMGSKWLILDRVDLGWNAFSRYGPNEKTFCHGLNGSRTDARPIG